MSMSGRDVIAARRAKVEALLNLEDEVLVLTSPSSRIRGNVKIGEYYARYSGQELMKYEHGREKFMCTEHRGGVVKRGKTKWERK